MKKSEKFVFLFTFRIILYAALMVFLNLVYIHDAAHLNNTGKFGENSWTEILQEASLFITGIIFIAIGRVDKELKPVADLFSVFFFMAIIREFNNQISFWPYLEIPLIILFLGLTVHYRTKLFSSILRLLDNRAIAWLMIGFLVTFVFSRFFGRTVFWQQLLENDYSRWAKNAAEEGIELLGYSLLFIGGAEIFVQAWRDRKKLKQ